MFYDATGRRISGYKAAALKSAHNRSHVPRKEFHQECVWCWKGGKHTPVRMPNSAEREAMRTARESTTSPGSGL